jgi:hypothetical protein
MHVVRHTADGDGFHAVLPRDSAHEGKEAGLKFSVNETSPFFR